MSTIVSFTNDPPRAPSQLFCGQSWGDTNRAGLALPLDRPRCKRERFTAAFESVLLGHNLASALSRLIQAEGAALPAVFFTAVQVLLARYSGQQEMTVHLCCEGGDQPGLSPQAEFTRLFPIHTELTQEMTLLQLAKKMSTDIATALLQAPPPAPAPERGATQDDQPRVQVMFFSEPSLLTAEESLSSPLSLSTQNLEYDLYWRVRRQDSGFSTWLMYDSDLFEPATIRRMLGHFNTLLEGFAAHAELQASELPLLTDSERSQILIEWNRTTAAYPNDRCVHQLVESQAERTPTAIAVQYGSQVLTYQELNQRANQLARHLRKVGVGPELPVGICLDRGLDLAIALLAVLKSGGACVPLDPQYPPNRLRFMLEDAHVALVLTEQNLLNAIQAKTLHLSREWETIRQQSGLNPTCSVTAQNLAYIIYTSGSTGKPRGVLLSHNGIVNHNVAAIKLYGLRPDDRILQFSSPSFDICIEEVFPTWITGATLVFKTEETPLAGSGFLHWVGKERISVLDLPTAYWHELTTELADLEQSLPPDLRLVIVGGEKASSKAYASWLKATKGKVRWINTYGPTEASVIATAFEPAVSDPHEVPASLPIGRPIANTQIYLLDKHLNPVPIGVAGELHIAGAGLARGYLNRPEITAAKFVPNPFNSGAQTYLYRTGDLACYLADGNIEFLGRSDFQVKIRGFRVEPGEVEAALAAHSSVREAVVIAKTDTSGEKRLIAYIVSKKGTKWDANELRLFLTGRLPEYMVPPVFVAIDSVPLTPNGKVDRRALETRTLSTMVKAESAESVDPIVRAMTKLWKSVLGVESIGPEDNFWDLGGHSLLAARLSQKVEKAFGKRLGLAALVQAPTVAQLVDLIMERSQTASWSCLIPLQVGGSQPPFFCVHGVGGNSVGFRDLAGAMGERRSFYGVQAQGLDGKLPCLTKVEDMAARYLQEIRNVQPQGPYFLGGFSFGGWVAFEMAQQLNTQGQEVALLALLDTSPFRLPPITSSLLSLLHVPTQQDLMYVLPKTVKKGIRRRLIWLRLPKPIKDVQRACYEAERTYQLRRYSGRITLFQATETLTTSRDPNARWRELAEGGVEVQEVAGHHGDIIVQPQVSILAHKLLSCLDRAQQEHAAKKAGMPSVWIGEGARAASFK